MLVGCLVALAVVAVIGITATIVVMMNWRAWTAQGIDALTAEAINASSLPEAEKGEMIAEVARLTTAFKDGQVELQALADFAESLEENRILDIGIAYQIEGAYVQASAELSDEEKAEGQSALYRFGYGLYTKEIARELAEGVTDPISRQGPDGSNDLMMPSEVTVEQLRDLIVRAKERADEAEIPEEVPVIDLSDALGAQIDAILTGTPAEPTVTEAEATAEPADKGGSGTDPDGP
ncbi:MAG: hypothetical protein AAFR38_09220 [Planctomycetota bacterium]